MIANWQADGVWWIPNQPDQGSTGKIVYDSQAGLQLIDIVGPLAPAQPQLGPGPEIILGYDHGGTRFTCVSSYYVGHNVNQANINVAKMDVELLVKGRHFNLRQDIRFRRFQSDYSNLHIWLEGLPPFQTLFPNDNTITLEFLRGGLWDAVTAEGVRLRNSYDRRSHFLPHPDSKFQLDYKDSLWATYENGVSPEIFCRHERIFRTLIDLLGDCQLQVAKLKVGLTPDGTDSEIFYPSRFGRNARRDPNRERMPVRYMEINERFNVILLRWFELFPQLEPIVSLYFLKQNVTDLNIENLFLAISQALEAFHRTFFHGTYMPPADYNEHVRAVLVNAIPAGLDQGLTDSLRARLRYGNEYSLRTRLGEVADSLPNTPTFAQAKSPQLKNRTANTRNHLTHIVVEPQDILEGAALYDAIQIWREALAALVLARIELTPEEINLAVRRMQAGRGMYVEL